MLVGTDDKTFKVKLDHGALVGLAAASTLLLPDADDAALAKAAVEKVVKFASMKLLGLELR